MDKHIYNKTFNVSVMLLINVPIASVSFFHIGYYTATRLVFIPYTPLLFLDIVSHLSFASFDVLVVRVNTTMFKTNQCKT